MKLLYVTLLLVFCAVKIDAQSLTAHLPHIKEQIAKAFEVRSSDVLALKAGYFEGRSYVTARVKKGENEIPVFQEFGTSSDGGVIPIGATITCNGKDCSQCYLEGLPNPKNVHCACGPAGGGGGCDMSWSIKIGG